MAFGEDNSIYHDRNHNFKLETPVVVCDVSKH